MELSKVEPSGAGARFVNIGERCNVTGSARFKKLVLAGDYDTAVEVAREAPFQEALGGHVRQSPVLAPEVYATLLHRLGFREQHVRLQVYVPELESREAVVEWVRGSVLTDYERRLPAELWPRFLERYRERLLPQLDHTRPFFYPFKRVLFWGAR